MGVTGKPSYDPAANLRSEFTKDEGDGERNPTPTLRIFGSNIGNQWLMYGGIGGGTQDSRSFRVYYTGIMEIGKDAIFGTWRVTVEGEGLEPVASQVAKQTKATLKIGDGVRGIIIEPCKVRQMEEEE